MTNKKLMEKFDAANKQQIRQVSYPWIGGYRAEFFQNMDEDVEGGWLLAIDITSPVSLTKFAFEIPQLWVDRAGDVEYDVYNDAAYAKAMLNLSDEYRGTLA